VVVMKMSAKPINPLNHLHGPARGSPIPELEFINTFEKHVEFCKSVQCFGYWYIELFLEIFVATSKLHVC